MVHHKITFELNTVFTERLQGGLIQFWSPEDIISRGFLSTSDQPFAFEDPFDDPCVTKYRIYFHNSKHKINDNTTANSSKNSSWFVMNS